MNREGDNVCKLGIFMTRQWWRLCFVCCGKDRGLCDVAAEPEPKLRADCGRCDHCTSEIPGPRSAGGCPEHDQLPTEMRIGSELYQNCRLRWRLR